MMLKEGKIKCSFLLLLIIPWGCSSSSETTETTNLDTLSKSPQAAEVPNKQLNISILLDLSDRLIQPMQPDQTERDLAAIGSILDFFKSDMSDKGAFKAEGRIKVLFSPIPEIPGISGYSQQLSFDLSEMDNIGKKRVYDSIQGRYRRVLSNIYSQLVEGENWQGANIYRFMKNDVEDLCIIKEEGYRNVLVILTDGYLYHSQSVDRIQNRTAYVTPKFLQNEGFRNNNDWVTKYEEGNYGLIEINKDLSDLEVLILELHPSEQHVNDEIILERYLSDWFSQMKVSKLAIHQTALPNNTKTRINSFLSKTGN